MKELRVSELRVSNLLYINGSIHQIVTISRTDDERDCLGLKNVGDRFYTSGILLKDCKPISLTEDWLIKFGIDECDEIGGYACKAHCYYILEDGIEMHLFCSNDKDCHIKLEYVHQLQNLYFPLMNEELELK